MRLRLRALELENPRRFRDAGRGLLCLTFAMALALLPAQVFTQTRAERDGRWAILVMGISGDPDLQKLYLKELVDLRVVLEKQLAFPRDQVIALFDNPQMDPAHIQHQSTRANLEKVCKEIAGKADKEDTVFIFLQGHGAADSSVYRLNLVGPDPTAVELSAMLDAIPSRRTIIVNATNCSGASIEALKGKGRIVISATKSGTEKNLTHLGKYFIEALAGNAADVDKNGRVSMLEAFSYTVRRVEEYYTKEGSMQSEHPMLNDNGDAKDLSLEDAADARVAALARSSYLDRGIFAVQPGMSPEMQALALEAQSLEKQIEVLKSVKDEMSVADYEKRLEELLLKLAEVQARLRKK